MPVRVRVERLRVRDVVRAWSGQFLSLVIEDFFRHMSEGVATRSEFTVPLASS